uniref:Uncharacterized protein n=1 Tax=Leersia perrieri TaxID=77586 RepID=A0A0D9VDR7_9ORYZ
MDLQSMLNGVQTCLILNLKITLRNVKKEQLRILNGFKSPVTNTKTILNEKFIGKVIEVASYVGKVHRREQIFRTICLRSKEFSRTRLIGKEVNVSMEYSRRINKDDGQIHNTMNSMGATAGFGVRLQAILVMSLLLMQIPFLPYALATGSEVKTDELLMGRETHHLQANQHGLVESYKESRILECSVRKLRPQSATPIPIRSNPKINLDCVRSRKFARSSACNIQFAGGIIDKRYKFACETKIENMYKFFGGSWCKTRS